MKTKDLSQIQGVIFNGGISYRFVLESDGVGFSMMETQINKGGPYLWHYQNHQEVCYCVSGYGKIIDLTTGEESEIRPGISYFIDDHQKHHFIANTNIVLISVFNPPLKGNETHDQNGNYN